MLLLAVGIALGALGRVARDSGWTSEAYVPGTSCGAAHGMDAHAADAHRRLGMAARGGESGVDVSSADGTDARARRSLSSSGAQTTITDDFVASIESLACIEPHTMLYIFLPALLFESANAIEFHVFKRVLGKVMLPP